METMTFIVEAIATVGFPIAICCYSLFLLNENDKRNDNEKNELYKYIKENTEVLQKLCDELDKER